jgi:hypothetical protein
LIAENHPGAAAYLAKEYKITPINRKNLVIAEAAPIRVMRWLNKKSKVFKLAFAPIRFLVGTVKAVKKFHKIMIKNPKNIEDLNAADRGFYTGL